MALIHGYRTLAETGRVLGVSAARVLEMVNEGPLIARQLEDGVYVHDEDLAAFRRPLFEVQRPNPGVTERYVNSIQPFPLVIQRPAAPLRLAASRGQIVASATETKGRRGPRKSR